MPMAYYNKWDDGTSLYHYGIIGQRWGIRRYQNPDGTWTEEGKRRRREVVFVSGSSKTQDASSGYYRKKLPKPVRKELDRYMRNGDKILVGDAPGIDRQVQDYLNDKRYGNVEIYGPGTEVRYSANQRWKTNPVNAPQYKVGSKEWLAEKDKAMSKAATKGLAVVLENGGAGATRRNVDRLLEANKDVKVFELYSEGYDRWIRH